MSILMTALKITGISILVLVGLGLSYQYIATKLDERNLTEYNLEHFDDVWGKLGDPTLVEQRFLELLPQAYQFKNKSIYLQMLSQLALAQAVQKKFDVAHATLDIAEKLLTPEYNLAKVRILCERGRTFQQAGDLVQARIYFEQSYELSDQCKFDKQTINAAHMIAIVAPTTEEKIAWNNKALELAMNSNDAGAQNWQAPLLNNLGANYLENKQLEKSLDAFEQALIAFKKSPEQQANILFARFRVAQVLRMLSRLDEALAMQLQQLKEYETITASGKFDIPKEMFVLMRGFVYEELAENYVAKKELDIAKKYAQLALADLDNQMFAIMDPTSGQRLERLKQIKD